MPNVHPKRQISGFYQQNYQKDTKMNKLHKFITRQCKNQKYMKNNTAQQEKTIQCVKKFHQINLFLQTTHPLFSPQDCVMGCV